MTTMIDIADFQQRRLAESRAAAPDWTIDDRIRKIRRISGMNQHDFAESVDVAVSVLKHWEAGTRQPRRSDLLMFAVKCQVTHGVPAWWTLGQDGPFDILADGDPRMRATALEVLALEAAQTPTGSDPDGGLENVAPPTGLEPVTLWFTRSRVAKDMLLGQHEPYRIAA